MEQYIDLRIEIPNEPTNIIRVRAKSFERAMTAIELFCDGKRTEGKELPEGSVYAQIYYIGRTEVRVSKPFLD